MRNADIHPLQRRTPAQNRLMWAILFEIAARVALDGHTFSPSEWKAFFTALLLREHGLACGDPQARTSRFNVEEMADLIELMTWFAAERGIARWSWEIEEDPDGDPGPLGGGLEQLDEVDLLEQRGEQGADFGDHDESDHPFQHGQVSAHGIDGFLETGVEVGLGHQFVLGVRDHAHDRLGLLLRDAGRFELVHQFEGVEGNGRHRVLLLVAESHFTTRKFPKPANSAPVELTVRNFAPVGDLETGLAQRGAA